MVLATSQKKVTALAALAILAILPPVSRKLTHRNRPLHDAPSSRNTVSGKLNRATPTDPSRRLVKHTKTAAQNPSQSAAEPLGG